MTVRLNFLSTVNFLINSGYVDKIYVKFNVNRDNTNCNVTDLIAVTDTKLDIKDLPGTVNIDFIPSHRELKESLDSVFLLWSKDEDEKCSLIKTLEECINIINDSFGDGVEELILFDTYESECGYSKDLVIFIKFTDDSKLFFEDCDSVSTKINLEFPNLFLTMLYQDRGGVRLWKKSSLS